MTPSASRHGEAAGSTRSFGRSPAPSTPAIDPADASEIDALFQAVTSAGDLPLRLVHRLSPLVLRCVPPRAIEAAPVPRAARVRFADGTSIVVKSATPGDVGVLALAMRRGSVRPAACTANSDGSARLVFSLPGAHGELAFRVVGLDQPD